jgi:hypothetical protein
MTVKALLNDTLTAFDKGVTDEVNVLDQSRISYEGVEARRSTSLFRAPRCASAQLN